MRKALWWGMALGFFYAAAGTGGAADATAGKTDWKLTSSVTYETGKFGTDTRTETVYVPFTLKRTFERWNLAVTIPYIHQETGPDVTAIEGRPFRIRRTSAGGVTTNSGLGDVVLKGGYDLLEEQDQPFNLSAVGKIKFPTADDDEGLGTGEFDEGLGLEASKRLDDRWTLFADVYYTFIGDPSGVNLDDEFAFDVGFGYAFSKTLSANVFYEYRTAISDGTSAPQDLFLGLEQKLSEAAKLFGGVSLGLSDGSPDVGVTLGFGYRF